MAITPFNRYITEAAVTEKNFSKAVDIFMRIFKKKTGINKFYRFDGPDGYCEIKGGIGILFFYGNAQAIRFNYISGGIQSITLWKKFKLWQPGDFTLDLSNVGLLQAGKLLIDYIQNPRVGNFAIYPEPGVAINESNNDSETNGRAFLLEATRISPKEFAEMVSHSQLDAGESLSKVSWETLARIALNNDKQVPTYIRKNCKIGGGKGRGNVSTYDLTQLLMSSDPATIKPTNDLDPIYYFKITSQDPTNKKFLSVKGDQKAAEMLRTAQKAITNPSNDIIKKQMVDVDTLFGYLSSLVSIVARGFRNSLVVYGGPGTGKSYTVGETLKQVGKKPYEVSGAMSTAELYKILFMNRSEDDLLLFDDCDGFWKDKDATNLLKAALDGYDERIISWFSAKTVNVGKMSPDELEQFNAGVDSAIQSDPTSHIKYPSQFSFKGRIIFISNLQYREFDTAVLSRSAKIDMTLTQEQIFKRMETVLPHMGDPNVPLETKKIVLGAIVELYREHVLSDVTMRAYQGAEGVYKSGDPKWKELLPFNI